MTVTFPSTSSTVTALNGFFWATGTQIYQTFVTGSGLNSIDQLSMSFSASYNYLSSVLQWQVAANGTGVGTFVMYPNSSAATASQLFNLAFSFPAVSSATPISGTYTLQMNLIVGAIDGDGAVQLGSGITNIVSV